MKLTPLAANMTEVETGKYRVLFSYKTPVAYKILGLSTVSITDYKWSATTTRHINKWLATFQYDVPTVKVPQAEIDDLFNKDGEMK